MMDFDRDLDFIRDEHEQRNGPVIVGRANLGVGDEPSWSAAVGFCPDCGYLWTLHDSSQASWARPFGCPPSETEARLRWGR